MYPPNEALVLARIAPDDVVLDVGGWARPFNRANYVIDFQPYETRGKYFREVYGIDAQGGPVEHFTADTYHQLDFCDRDPWPFADRSIDFCICSHTLEDIRDPLWVCSEMRRVAKRGYIEVPSRLFEACRDREAGVPVGLSHHRWIVEIAGTHITFSPKCHYVHGDPKLSLPKSFWQALPESSMATWLFWDGDLTWSEGWHSRDDHAAFARLQLESAGLAAPADSDPMLFEVWKARDERDAALAELAALRSHLGEAGPRSLHLARQIGRASRRVPALSSLVKRLVRVA
jgi:hypothetical protein